MAIEQSFPWKELESYSISAWLNDLINIVKKRAFLMKKEEAWILVMENMNEFLECYVDGMKPIEAWNEFEGIEE